MAVCQNLVPLVNIKIAGKWMFIPLKMVLIGIDPYPYCCLPRSNGICKQPVISRHLRFLRDSHLAVATATTLRSAAFRRVADLEGATKDLTRPKRFINQWAKTKTTHSEQNAGKWVQ